jgi:hypothetical protein
LSKGKRLRIGVRARRDQQPHGEEHHNSDGLHANLPKQEERQHLIQTSYQKVEERREARFEFVASSMSRTPAGRAGIRFFRS